MSFLARAGSTLAVPGSTGLVVLFVLLTPVAAARADETRPASVSLEAGAYRVFDRADALYDGPEVAVGGALPLASSWTFLAELGAAGEFAGGRGTCVGELAARLGPSLTLRPRAPLGRARWAERLHLDLAGGTGLAFVRLYGSLFSMQPSTDPKTVAYGDRAIPQLWLSTGVGADFGPLTLSLEANVRHSPSAMFRAEHVPDGMRPEFYPVFRREHDLSTYGVTAGLALRL